MTTYRYTALNAVGAADAGELTADGPAEARAALRRLGLRPMTISERRRPRAPSLAYLSRILAAHLRRRRTAAKAELIEDVATLLDAGVPLAEAAATLAGSMEPGSRARRALVLRLREGLRAGSSFSAALREHPSWFDAVDIAMVEAGEHAGTLPAVLRSLGARHARTGELSQKIVAAMAYPLIVFAVGVGVLLFLSNVTLPKLLGVLVESGIAVPPLTGVVTSIGQSILHLWPLLLALGAVAAGAIGWLRHAVAHGAITLPDRLRRLVPSALRRAALAEVLRELSALLRCGVPLVEALRVAAPTAGGPGAASLKARLAAGATRVERGEDLSAALDDPLWFSAPLRRAVHVGEASGELPDLLDRLADGESRRCRLLADRLAGLLEPTAILTLAVLIGVVVMAAIQPLIRLQEVIR